MPLKFYLDLGDLWLQFIYIYPLPENLQNLDFGMFLGQGIGHDLYD